MEFIHKKKAEVQRSKMLSDQAVARRERTKDKRVRREQRILQKRTELLGKTDDDDTNVAVQQAIEQQAQGAPAAQQPATGSDAKAEKKAKKSTPAKTQQEAPAATQKQPEQKTKQAKKK